MLLSIVERQSRGTFQISMKCEQQWKVIYKHRVFKSYKQGSRGTIAESPVNMYDIVFEMAVIAIQIGLQRTAIIRPQHICRNRLWE